MKLICELPARKDGTVLLALGDKEYVFKRSGASGALEGEVPEALALAALDTNHFYPATEEDEALAEQLDKARGASGALEGKAPDDLPHDPNAPPIEGAAAKKKQPAKAKA